MKKVINCFKEDNPLIQKTLRRVTVEEGYEIIRELFQILNKRGDLLGWRIKWELMFRLRG